MMDFMYGITGRSCMKSNSDSLNKSVDKSFYDSRGFFAVDQQLIHSNTHVYRAFNIICLADRNLD